MGNELCKCGKVGIISCPKDERCGKPNTQLPADKYERICKEAEAHAKGIGDVYRKYAALYGYIAGATVEAAKTERLIDIMQEVIRISDRKHDAWDRAKEFIQQWKEGKQVEFYICPCCKGDGKETCTNPDHGFIAAIPGDIGRLGCPVCGHDPKHKVKNGGSCEICDGSGKVTIEQFNSFCNETGYDDEPMAWKEGKNNIIK